MADGILLNVTLKLFLIANYVPSAGAVNWTRTVPRCPLLQHSVTQDCECTLYVNISALPHWVLGTDPLLDV